MSRSEQGDDHPSPNAPDPQDDLYNYDYDGGASMADRPLPAIPLPSAPPAETGQSSRELATHDTAENMRRLTVSTATRDKGTETFVVRQLPIFAGTYDGDLVGEWVDETQILKKMFLRFPTRN